MLSNGLQQQNPGGFLLGTHAYPLRWAGALQHLSHPLGARRLLTGSVRFRQRNNRYSVSESLLALLCLIPLGPEVAGRPNTTQATLTSRP